VALSGTLETFSLPDVLRLLSSTKKTGLLALDGDRGRGRIWVRDGAIVAADADRAGNDQLDGVAFELLRFVAADFVFDSGAEAPVDGDAHDVDAVLAEAETRLAEWHEIEAVVPSLDVWVRMVTELDTERAVTPAQWRVLAQVGTGATGHDLGHRLGQGEYDVCRQLRDLVQDGMVELDEAPVAHEAPAAVAPLRSVDVDAAWDTPVEPSFVEPDLDADDVSHLGADLASFVAAGTEDEAVAIGVDEDEPQPETEAEADLVEVAPPLEAMVDTGDVEDEPEAEPADDADVMSQLSQLSPKAAAAVEATWSEDTEDTEADEADEADEQPAAAVEAAEPAEGEVAPTAAGDDIDQNLLLRFLSSAKG